MKPLTPAEATARYSAATSTEHRLIGPLTGGETGATEIEVVGGERRVLKWEADPDRQLRRKEAMTLAEQLRVEAGWPVPRQHAVDDEGWLFVTQEFMAGDTVTRLSHALVDDLVALHRRRLALPPPEVESFWGTGLIELLVEGGNGYCLHDPLRTHGLRSRRLVERIEEIGRSLSPTELSGSNIVHGDLHPGNLLAVDGRLSAVIDLDFAEVGDAAWDLAYLAITAVGTPADAGVKRRLYTDGLEVLDEQRRAAYVGAMLLRVLDWSIRKHRDAETEFWLDRADRMFGDQV